MTRRRLSLTTQLIGLLVCGLLATNLIAMLVDDKTYGDIPPLEKKQAIERLTVAWRLLEKCAGCDIDALLDGLNHGQASFALLAANPLAEHTMNAGEAALAAQIERSGGIPENSVRVRQSWQHAWPLTSLAEADSELTAVLRRGDRWLTATQRTSVFNRWWRPLLFALPASVLPVLLLVAVFARRLLRPLGELEAAASRISQGQAIAPLAARGPREIRSLIEAFNSMQDSLARHIRDKTHMLAAISHDLRTPITSLRLRAELLADGPDKAGIIRTLLQLQGMVDEVLTFLRDDAASEARRHLDLSLLLAGIAAQRRQMRQPVDFAGPLKCPFTGYPLALTRAVDNLLDNALRYGSRAELSLQIADDHLRIGVADDGPGIPDEWRERVFEPFVRIDRERSSSHGVGLGLSIVRACVQRHGGTITLSNRPGGGLDAAITLPLTVDAPAP